MLTVDDDSSVDNMNDDALAQYVAEACRDYNPDRLSCDLHRYDTLMARVLVDSGFQGRLVEVRDSVLGQISGDAQEYFIRLAGL